MTRQHLRRCALIAVLLPGMLLAACASNDGETGTDARDSTNVETPDRVTVALDWLAQTSNAGFYVAEANGYYDDAGIDVTIQPGGTSSTSVQIVAGDGAQFGLEYATQLLQAREQGIDVVSLAPTLQTTPSVYVFHAGQDIASIADLEGRTVHTQPASAEWEYVASKYELTDVSAVQFQGSYAAFAADETSVAQGYATSSPQQLQEQGIEVDTIKQDSADINYGSSLFTTQELIDSDPELVSRFVEATARGWSDIQADPQAAAEILIGQVPDSTVDALTAEFAAQAPYVFEGDAAEHQYGWQSEQRWDAIAELALAWGIISDVSVAQGAWTTEFLRER